jgi:hypothetical protein
MQTRADSAEAMPPEHPDAKSGGRRATQKASSPLPLAGSAPPDPAGGAGLLPAVSLPSTAPAARPPKDRFRSAADRRKGTDRGLVILPWPRRIAGISSRLTALLPWESGAMHRPRRARPAPPPAGCRDDAAPSPGTASHQGGFPPSRPQRAPHSRCPEQGPHQPPGSGGRGACGRCLFAYLRQA